MSDRLEVMQEGQVGLLDKEVASEVWGRGVGRHDRGKDRVRRLAADGV